MIGKHLDRDGALDLAARHGIPLDVDFHTLDFATMEAVIAAADERRYRKPPNANGSRARYFHAYLRRRATKKD